MRTFRRVTVEAKAQTAIIRSASASQEYVAAIAAHDAASVARRAAVAAYRAQEITDQEFIEANAKWKAACAVFDAAFDAAAAAGVTISDQEFKDSNPYA